MIMGILILVIIWFVGKAMGKALAQMVAIAIVLFMIGGAITMIGATPQFLSNNPELIQNALAVIALVIGCMYLAHRDTKKKV